LVSEHSAHWAKMPLRFIFCLCLLISLPVNAKRLALVLGNDNYTSVTKLQKAVNDAAAMDKELKAAGFEVKLYTDLNYRDMVKAIDTFTQSISVGDEVVVFYAGHGVQIKNGNYLLPTDIDASSESLVEKTAYELHELTDKLSEAKPGFTLILVDACRDNPLKKAGRSVGNSRGLGAVEPPKGQIVIYSASRGQMALDRLSNQDTNPNGIFTREFIKRMKKPGLEIEALVREVQDAVEALAKTINHEQRPGIYKEYRGSFFFYKPDPPVVIVNQPPKAPIMKPGGVMVTTKDCAECPELISIPAGRFVMGALPGEEEIEKLNPNLRNRSQPQLEVQLQPFLVSRHEVTVGQYRAFAEVTGRKNDGGCIVWNGKKTELDSSKNWQNTGFLQEDSHPVTCVSWEDASAYVQWLKKKTGKDYRLLSESEWEYAVRAGSTASRFWGEDSARSCTFANGADLKAKENIQGYQKLSVARCNDGHTYTAPVGSYRANAFGLFDMLGNVWEWTQDCWLENYLGANQDGKPRASGDCTIRVLRGGSWLNLPEGLRSAYRVGYSTSMRFNFTGIRIARTAEAIAETNTNTSNTTVSAPSCPTPEYPAQSRRNNEQGSVNLKLLIDIQGQVKSIEVAKSSGFSALDDAALNSLKLCKFTPANIDGKSAERWTNMSYTFKME